jgi:beta-galactosidase
MQTRRDFLKILAITVPASTCLSAVHGYAQPGLPATERFLFGADVYPDIQSREQNKTMLDLLQSAHMNIVRVGDANWGNLELAPGQFNFGWLRDFLNDLHQRQISAIVGTSTFVPPQWLAGAHPEALVVLAPGSGPSDPMSRKSPCLNHPLYREACRRYIQALAEEFHDHPAVIGWQLDNEIEFVEEIVCYNPACEHAWRQWLEQSFHTPKEFNESLDLVSWGMQIRSFDDVPQPRPGVEASRPAQLHSELPALSLAELHFRRDVILDFLAEQAAILRKNGVKQWILTDWNPVWTALADEPKAQHFMSIAGLNYYQSSADKPESWNDSPWHLDMHRSCYQKGRFIVTETRFGVTGSTEMWDPAPTKEQFQMWDLQLVAFGAAGLLYWSGNRWRGGHWPHWGGLLDWSGRPEPDIAWAIELGRLFETWGQILLAHPVDSRAVVFTDFDSRAALEIYPHIPHSKTVFMETFSALHRLGIGTDTINSLTVQNLDNLSKYDLVLLPAATALDSPLVVEALRQYVVRGGTLVVTPFTAYMDRNGVFRGDGFGANLLELTGGFVRTVRWVGSPDNGDKQQLVVNWSGSLLSGQSPVGLDGYMEYFEIRHPDTKVIATFESKQDIVNGRPAAALRTLGRGQVIKLAFWPRDDSFPTLISKAVPATQNLLAAPLPDGVLALPRTDHSLFVINATSQAQSIALRSPSQDRLSKRSLSPEGALKPYEVLWLEA